MNELCSGPCLVLEVQGSDAARTFRELCGPADPVSLIVCLFIFVSFRYLGLIRTACSKKGAAVHSDGGRYGRVLCSPPPSEGAVQSWLLVAVAVAAAAAAASLPSLGPLPETDGSLFTHMKTES